MSNLKPFTTMANYTLLRGTTTSVRNLVLSKGYRKAAFVDVYSAETKQPLKHHDANGKTTDVTMKRLVAPNSETIAFCSCAVSKMIASKGFNPTKADAEGISAVKVAGPNGEVWQLVLGKDFLADADFGEF